MIANSDGGSSSLRKFNCGKMKIISGFCFSAVVEIKLEPSASEKIKVKGREKMKRGHIAGIIVLAVLFGGGLAWTATYFVQVKSLKTELQQYRVSVYVMGEIQRRDNEAIVSAWWDMSGTCGIPKGSLVLLTSKFNLFAVSPTTKVTKHGFEGNLISSPPIEVPDAAGRVQTNLRLRGGSSRQ